MSRPLKELSKYAVHKNCCSENFLQIILKASMADFIFSKFYAFSTFSNTFRGMRLKYENYSRLT